jgi:hypothetical protein
MDQQLRFAIAQKRLIQFRYHDAIRVAEPHDYGRHKGVDRLFVWQVRKNGEPIRGNGQRWRLLDVAQIEALEVLEETFPGSRGREHANHREWDGVYARVS